ncbi:MAG: hypothetical protein IT198_07845 [Acidimicrobiia bacterium]|nr:hypothetical protein [Acidimicrobiia bacterium]
MLVSVAGAVVAATGLTAFLLLRPGSGPDSGKGDTARASTPQAAATTAAPTTYPATTTSPAGGTSVPPTSASTAAGGWQVTNTTRGRSGVDTAAIALAQAYALLPVDADATRQCPGADMEVSYTEPDFHFTLGAFAPPLGPPPDETTTSVNGVVVCGSSEYAIMGFEASWSDMRGAWTLIPVPAVD